MTSWYTLYSMLFHPVVFPFSRCWSRLRMSRSLRGATVRCWRKKRGSPDPAPTTRRKCGTQGERNRRAGLVDQAVNWYWFGEKVEESGAVKRLATTERGVLTDQSGSTCFTYLTLSDRSQLCSLCFFFYCKRGYESSNLIRFLNSGKFAVYAE